METTGQSRLPPPLLAEILAELADDSTQGILLGGSFARAEETPFSDVDLLVFRTGQHGRLGENRYFRSKTEDRLVAWSVSTVQRELGRMRQPRSALWVVPGIRQAMVLFDRGGAIAPVKAAAQSFRWETLGRRALAAASDMLAGNAEELLKLVAGLHRRDAFSIANALSGLSFGLSEAVALGRGILIETENRWLRAVEDSVGTDSPWSISHRQMFGIDGDRPSTLSERAKAGLRCYLETASLLDDVLRPEDRRVVELARHAIEGH